MLKCASFDIGERNLSLLIGTVPKKYSSVMTFVNCVTIKEIHLFDVNDIADDGLLIKCESVIKSGKNKGNICGRKCNAGSTKCGVHQKPPKLSGNAPPKPSRGFNHAPPKPSRGFKKCSLIYTNKQKFCSLLVGVLKTIQLADIDLFIIERQPPKNRIMNEISHYLFMYLTMNTNSKIIYFNAKKRMADLCNIFCEECEQNNGPKFNKNNTYHNRKMNSIKLALYLCDKHIKKDSTVKCISDYRKKDDIADCLMQLIFYFVKKFIN